MSVQPTPQLAAICYDDDDELFIFQMQVIQYVQFLQEKVQKYEGPVQPWNSEPTKLMPWVVFCVYLTSTI